MTTTTTTTTLEDVHAVIGDWGQGGVGYHYVVRTVLAHAGLAHDEAAVRTAIRVHAALRLLDSHL